MRRQMIFAWIAIGCGLFVILTLVAMLFYPGGTLTDHSTRGYSFFRNFFSELGFTVTSSGASNWTAAVLFFISLFLAGIALVVFFYQFQRLFPGGRLARGLGFAGTLLGMLAGICFAGVAFTPANLYLVAHTQFVLWAFRLFPLAVFCYTILLFMDQRYPKKYGYVFLGFFVLLAAYYWLLSSGPDFNTPTGNLIQAVGQKVIVYASIVAIMIQSLGARIFLTENPVSI